MRTTPKGVNRTPSCLAAKPWLAARGPEGRERILLLPARRPTCASAAGRRADLTCRPSRAALAGFLVTPRPTTPAVSDHLSTEAFAQRARNACAGLGVLVTPRPDNTADYRTSTYWPPYPSCARERPEAVRTARNRTGP